MAKLILDKLIKIYNGKKVVDSMELEVESGKAVGLLGPNGAGKTTTFYMTVGLIQPDGGRVFYDSEDITGLPVHVRARRGVGYLPQEPSVFKKLSVLQNVMIILESFPLTKIQQRERAESLLEELGILGLSDRRAGVLSGGERRRLEITRALAANPSFILLDEPFAGIDPIAIIDIKNIVRHLVDRGIGVLISDHNVKETLKVCDIAYIVNEGKMMLSGPPDEIAANEMAKRIYLGNDFSL